MKKCVLVAAVMAVVAFVPTAPMASGAVSADALVRVAHFSPDTAGVDVWVDGQRVLENVGYDTVSDYVPLPAGSHTFALRPFGAAATSKPVLSATAPLAASTAYTIAGVGLNAELRGQIFQDDLGAPPAGRAKVRVIDAVVGPTSIAMMLTGGTSFSTVKFATASTYKPVAASAYHVRVRTAGDPGQLLNLPSVRVSEGIIYSFAVIGGGGKPLQVVPVVDARGPAVTPLGSAATGGGGTARVRVHRVRPHAHGWTFV